MRWQDFLCFSHPAKALNRTIAHFDLPTPYRPGDTPRKLSAGLISAITARNYHQNEKIMNISYRASLSKFHPVRISL